MHLGSVGKCKGQCERLHTASPDQDGNGWQVVKLDSTIGSRVGYFGRFRDFSNSDFIMNTAGA